MLTGLNNNGLYDINNINKKGMYGNMRDDTGEQTSDRKRDRKKIV